MNSKLVSIDPGGWVDAVERIGLGGTVILILTLFVGTAFIVRGPALLNSLNGILSTILKHQRENKRIQSKIVGKQENLKSALGARNRKGNVRSDK